MTALIYITKVFKDLCVFSYLCVHREGRLLSS